MKKQIHNNKRLSDEQFAQLIKSIATLWALVTGRYCPDPAKPEVKLIIGGFELRDDHGVAVKTLKFFGDVKSETNQEEARRNALEVKQALLGLLRAFLSNHLRFFDNERRMALAGVNRFLWTEYADGSEKIFEMIKVENWEESILRRIENRREELEAGKTKLRNCMEAEDFVPFIILQNKTLIFMSAVCEEMKRIAGNRAPKTISEAAKDARKKPETVGKSPKKSHPASQKVSAFNPAFADLLADI